MSDPADPAGPERRSGLRDPAAAARALGSAVLAVETVVLLLAIQPIRMLGGGPTGAAVAAACGLALTAVVLAGLMRRPWAWHAGTVLQVLVLAAGLLHWSLAAVGVIFGAVWLYATHVRRVLLG